MTEELSKLQRDGQYEKALTLAKRHSIDSLKQNKREEAAFALARAGEILCQMNHPGKARSFALEAYDLAQRNGHRFAAAYAQAIAALAHLRLAEFDKAEQTLDTALDILNIKAEDEHTILAKFVASEISLAKEDYAEARAFSEDAFAAAAALQRPDLKARSCLVKAICEARAGDINAAIELLSTAEAELQRENDVQTAWMVRGAMANACAKAGKESVAENYRQAARDIIQKIVAPMTAEARDRFLKNPAVQTALGEGPGTVSGLWKVPVQIPTATPPPVPPEDSTLLSLRPVLEMIKKINSELNLRKLITMILDTMIEFSNAQRGTIVVFEGERFKVEIARNREKQDLKRFEMGISRTILKLVRDKGKVIVCNDAQNDPNLKLVDSVHDQTLLSILCLPLRVKMRLVGAVYLDNPYVVGAFGDKEVGLAEILTDHAAVAIDNALLHIKSIHDGLTNLFNHSHFEKRLESEVARARRHGRPCGLLMLDVDDFKHINDTYGHEAGNEVLKTLSRLITTTVRNVDLVARIESRPEMMPVVARYGGDEFEIILPETNKPGVQRAAERILEAATGEKWSYNGHALAVHISVGGAVFPDDAPDAGTLVLKADEALYAAKRAGKNRFMLYRARDAAAQAES